MQEEVQAFQTLSLIQFQNTGIVKTLQVVPFLQTDIHKHKPKVYTIGSDPTCSIKLNDISISRMQSSLVLHRKDVQVMDGGCDFKFNLLNQVELQAQDSGMLQLDLAMHEANYFQWQFELIRGCEMIKRSPNGTWINIQNIGLCLEHDVEFKEVQSIHEDCCEFIDPCKFKLGDTIFELDQVQTYDEEIYNLIYALGSNNGDWGNATEDNWDVT